MLLVAAGCEQFGYRVVYPQAVANHDTDAPVTGKQTDVVVALASMYTSGGLVGHGLDS